MSKTVKKIQVTIGILTYNHEKYIEECLSSVISQTGEFDLRIIVVNDNSKDGTDEIIKNFIKKNKNTKIEYYVNEENLGAQKSIYKTLNLIKKTKPDYWSYIEGDDKYLSDDRTQKHLDLLESNESSIGSYNKLLLIDENSQLISKHEPDYTDKTISTEQLAAHNHIGSFCATFYRAACFDHFNVDEFEGLTVYDWFFNIWMSQYGEVRQLNEYLSGYRQHTASVWSSKSQTDKYWELIWSIDSYNRKLNFTYDDAFQSYKRDLINQLSIIGNTMEVNVVIAVDKFPRLNDDFVTNEIKYLLNNNDNIALLLNAQKGKNSKDLIKEYKQSNQNVASKIVGYNGSYLIRAKCIYATSINDAYRGESSVINDHEAVLIFEICRGDEEKIKKMESGTKKILKSIFSSVNFARVIVHSEDIKKCLIDAKLCSEDNIILIPSSVSQKIYGKDNVYGPAQIESFYFQVDNLLKRCAAGNLQLPQRKVIRKVKIYYRMKKPVAIRKGKALIKRNRGVFFVARVIRKPVRLIYKLKGVK